MVGAITDSDTNASSAGRTSRLNAASRNYARLSGNNTSITDKRLSNLLDNTIKALTGLDDNWIRRPYQASNCSPSQLPQSPMLLSLVENTEYWYSDLKS